MPAQYSRCGSFHLRATPTQGVHLNDEGTGYVLLLPIPEANTRLAALRSGQADWIEVPVPRHSQHLLATNNGPAIIGLPKPALGHLPRPVFPSGFSCLSGLF